MEETYKKFSEKNKELLDELNLFIDENRGNIRCLVASSELTMFLNETELGGEKRGVNFRYNGIRILEDPYHPSPYLSFVMKDMKKTFNIPCLCGYFKDEKHP